MNTKEAIKRKDLKALAAAPDLNSARIVVLDTNDEPQWDRIAELWAMSQHGARMPSRAMTPADAIARRSDACPVSGAPLYADRTSSEYSQLNFAGVDRNHLRRIAAGCREAQRHGRSEPEIADLVAAYLGAGSATFEKHMDAAERVCDCATCEQLDTMTVTGAGNLVIQGDVLGGITIGKCFT